MHLILSLYDAPVPARGALAALRASGVETRDIAVVPPLGAATEGAAVDAGPPVDPSRLALPEGDDAIVKALGTWGVPHDEAQLFAAGVHRGAILVAVRTPTLSAEHVRATMVTYGAVPLSVHQARWEADPALRYGWSSVGAPEIEGPRSQLDESPAAQDPLASDDD